MEAEFLAPHLDLNTVKLRRWSSAAHTELQELRIGHALNVARGKSGSAQLLTCNGW